MTLPIAGISLDWRTILQTLSQDVNFLHRERRQIWYT